MLVVFIIRPQYLDEGRLTEKAPYNSGWLPTEFVTRSPFKGVYQKVSQRRKEASQEAVSVRRQCVDEAKEFYKKLGLAIPSCFEVIEEPSFYLIEDGDFPNRIDPCPKIKSYVVGNELARKLQESGLLSGFFYLWDIPDRREILELTYCDKTYKTNKTLDSPDRDTIYRLKRELTGDFPDLKKEFGALMDSWTDLADICDTFPEFIKAITILSWNRLGLENILAVDQSTLSLSLEEFGDSIARYEDEFKEICESTIEFMKQQGIKPYTQSATSIFKEDRALGRVAYGLARASLLETDVEVRLQEEQPQSRFPEGEYFLAAQAIAECLDLSVPFTVLVDNKTGYLGKRFPYRNIFMDGEKGNQLRNLLRKQSLPLVTEDLVRTDTLGLVKKRVLEGKLTDEVKIIDENWLNRYNKDLIKELVRMQGGVTI